MTLFYITVSPKSDTTPAKQSVVMFKGDLTTDSVRRDINAQIKLAIELRETLKARGIEFPDRAVPMFTVPARKQGFRWIGGKLEEFEYSTERASCVKEEDLPESLFHTI